MLATVLNSWIFKGRVTHMERPILWQIPALTSAAQSDLVDKITVLQRRLLSILAQHQEVRFAHSLAVEDTVIMDVLYHLQERVSVFTLDTGRLSPESLDLLERLQQHYADMPIQVYQPHAQQLDEYIAEHGKNAFYESVEQRKRCCYIRKVEPLNRALQGADAWLTGQRQSQSVTRHDLPFQEHDEQRHMAKYNPIFDWSEVDVWTYVQQFNLPFNQLYRQGYPSIGCDPCTRPVKQGEDIRAGRWWWENQDSKECGLHQS